MVVTLTHAGRRIAPPLPCSQECGECRECRLAAIHDRARANAERFAAEQRREMFDETWAPHAVGPLYTAGAGGSLPRGQVVAGRWDAERLSAGRSFAPALTGPPAQPVTPISAPPVDASLFQRLPPKALTLRPLEVRWHAHIGTFSVEALTDAIALSALRRKVIQAAWAARHRGVRYYGERTGLRKAGVR